MERKNLDEESVLRYIGLHGGTDYPRFASHFDLNPQVAKEALDSLYAAGKLVVFASSFCPDTGTFFSAQRLEGQSLVDYVYQCEDMDGECVFCGSEHFVTIEEMSLFFVLHESLQEKYPHKRSKK